MSFFSANLEQKSPRLALLYLAQDIEMPSCVGDGAADPLPDESDGGEDVALLVAVELLEKGVELLDPSTPFPSPPPGCCAFALMDAFDIEVGI